MNAIKSYVLVCVVMLVLFGYVGCVGMPKIEKPQFTQRHYSYSVLLVPEKLGNSPQLELGMSLLRMEYPAEQAESLHNLLYGQASLDVYRETVFSEQRRIYRERAGDLPADGNGTLSFNWRYAEKFSVKQIYEQGIVIERDLETYSGGANFGRNMQYYNIEIDADGFRLLTLDDFFTDFQEDQQFRDIVYAELREYNNLDSGQALSQGIYFNNQPELTFKFFIMEEGLGLYWDPAQIAPRSYGSVQIILPWYLVQPLMLGTGIELLAKFNIYLLVNNEEW